MKLFFIISSSLILSHLIISGEISFILPFLVSYVAAKLFRPVSLWICRKIHLGEKLGCAVFSCLLMTLFICAAVGFFSRITALIDSDSFSLYLSELGTSCLSILDSIPILSNAENARLAVASYSGDILSDILSKVASYIASFAASLPSLALSAVVCAVSFFYFMTDMEEAEAAAVSLIPERHRKSLTSAYKNVSDAIFGYIRGGILLSLATFCVLFVGFLVIRIPSPLKYSALIALADALPLIGCGAILVPWGVLRIVTHKTASGVSILVLYAVIWATRQYLEPKILGRMMGIEPVIMLAVVYIGWKTGGICGIILLAAAVCAVKSKKLPPTSKNAEDIN